jgi:hypothetical protein
VEQTSRLIIIRRGERTLIVEKKLCGNVGWNLEFQWRLDPAAMSTIYPYLYIYIAQNFGWANRMFQTNRGPSAPD